MRKEKQIIPQIVLFLLSAILMGCTKTEEPKGRQEIQPTTSEAAIEEPLGAASPESQIPNAAPPEHAYISITYGRDNEENPTGREVVFYTYDLTARELEEVCVLPFDVQYASGVVSRENQMVYYSRCAAEGDLATNDCLFAYDLQTGESTMLEQENWSYNDITLLDPETLLVMAVTMQHPITPAQFNLSDHAFKYLSDVNNEPPALYTSGPAPLSYNFKFGTFVYIFQAQEDRYDDAYLSFEKAIDTHIALVPAELRKDLARIYTVNWNAEHKILWAAQISENELLLRTDEVDVSGVGIAREAVYYSLVFDDTQSTLTQCEPPYPDPMTTNVSRCITLDGGNTYYIYYT